MHAKVKDGAVLKFPYTMQDLRAENPHTEFTGADIATLFSRTEQGLAGAQLIPVVMTASPEFNPVSERLVQLMPQFEGGTLRMRWGVEQLSAELVAANKASFERELQDSIVDRVQRRLDDFAGTRNYDGILSACTYATSGVPKFAAEGQYCVGARDATWSTVYAILDQVAAGDWPTAGAGRLPSGYDEIEPLLPVLEWPAS